MEANNKEVLTTEQAQLLIITGISGSGKSSVLKILEDHGYFCVDNFIPPLLIPFIKMTSTQFNLIAVVVDTRGGKFFSELSKEVQALKDTGFNYRVLFLDASDEALIKRFSETRRRHPLLSEESALLDSIQMERSMLEEVKTYADTVIDTSNFSTSQLRSAISETLLDKKLATAAMRISIMSFGFKYGVPIDADLMFDVRFLPNPHYIETLRPQTGLDNPVRDFVFEKDVTKAFLEKFLDFVTYLVPHYKEEGKSLLTVAIGCTGGRHRSVAIASKLSEELKAKNYYVTERHRDIGRNQEYYQKK
ncbi:MAG: RNase adapter RapZ [Candidatus Sericytochromatia bacterium]